MKLMGCVLIFAAVFRIQLLWERERKRRCACLDALIFAFRQMKGEIKFNLRPLPQLLDLAGKADQPDVGRFFRSVGAEVRSGEKLDVSWQRHSAELLLTERCGEALDKLGKSLSWEEDSVLGALELTVTLLEEEYNRMERSQKQDRQNLRVSTISAAVLLIIVLC